MNSIPIVDIIIPAFNEEKAIAEVIRALPSNLLREIIVVNNSSTDQTRIVAEEAGATVIDEPRKGYGNACLMGIAYIDQKAIKPDIVTFIDGDYADFPEELINILQPLFDNQADFVIGSRSLGNREKGAMTPQQIFGNWLATTLIRWLYKVKFTDLGPFRAINYTTLKALKMEDKNYGWTVEMQLKAAKMGFKSIEIPVSYKKRIGTSKVSGTIKGTIGAGYKILYSIFKYL